MKRTIQAALVVAICATLSLSEPLALESDGTIFTARLSVMPLDDAARFRGQSTITGLGQVEAVLSGRKLVITGTFEGMQAPATAARIHVGPKTGVRGPAISELEISAAPSGTISGEIELTPDQVRFLERARLYIQVHSEISPEGNLWGWLIPPEGLK